MPLLPGIFQMSTWLQPLQSALRAIPKDVEVKAIRKVVNDCLKEREPVPASVRGYEIPLLLNTDAFLEAWAMYERHRSEKRAKLTAQAARQQLKNLQAMGVERAIAAINYSVGNGWTGIFEPKQQHVFRNLKEEIAELVKARNFHPCYPHSVNAVDIDAQTSKQRQEYADIKRKLAELEQAQRRQVMA